MRRDLRLIATFANTPWALEQNTLEAMTALLARHAAGEKASDDEIKATIEARGGNRGAGGAPYMLAGDKGNVAVIPVYGVIAHRASMVDDVCGPGGTSTEALDFAIRSAIADPQIRSLVLDVDSPGGSVFGVQELAATIMDARQAKPIAAVANATAASAAYWIASAAHEIYVTPSGEVGSIGVFAVHTDTTKADEASGKVQTVISAGKYKAEGIGPLTDEAKAYMQGRVDAYYTQFVKGIAKARGVSADVVRSAYGQGRVLGADQALTAGMVDGVATLSDVVGKYARRSADAANRPRASVAEANLRIAAASVPVR